jgi:hypothetical protein
MTLVVRAKARDKDCRVGPRALVNQRTSSMSSPPKSEVHIPHDACEESLMKMISSMRLCIGCFNDWGERGSRSNRFQNNTSAVREERTNTSRFYPRGLPLAVTVSSATTQAARSRHARSLEGKLWFILEVNSG